MKSEISNCGVAIVNDKCYACFLRSHHKWLIFKTVAGATPAIALCTPQNSKNPIVNFTNSGHALAVAWAARLHFPKLEIARRPAHLPNLMARWRSPAIITNAPPKINFATSRGT